MKRVLGLVVLALLACGPAVQSEHPPGYELVRDAIVGGNLVTSGDDNVFLLIIQGNNGQGSECSSTLIGSRTLLTASHCVDPTIIGATSADIYASNALSESQIQFGVNTFHVIDTRHHPNWDKNTLEGDIAVALLDRAPAVTAKPWNTQSINSLGGRTIRSVGYGTTGGTAMAGGGIKRTVALTFRQLYSDVFFLGNQTDKGICHGDSGGPSFYTFSDGVERVVGVHSFTRTQDCLDGADTRVDYYASFVQQYLNEKEGPSCAADGQCKQGCTPVDVDCVCKADGVCSAACTDFSKDPDCPANCGTDGVCATATCPRPDTDCAAELSHCTTTTQCASRRCVIDPQHTDAYCSRSCTSSSQCDSGTECDTVNGFCRFIQLPTRNPGESCVKGQAYCTGNTFCTGTSAGSTSCVAPCAQTTDCPAKYTCIAGADGKMFCQEPPKPPIFLATAHAEGPVAAGCVAAPGLMLWALAGLALLRRRRVR